MFRLYVFVHVGVRFFELLDSQRTPKSTSNNSLLDSFCWVWATNLHIFGVQVEGSLENHLNNDVNKTTNGLCGITDTRRGSKFLAERSQTTQPAQELSENEEARPDR